MPRREHNALSADREKSRTKKRLPKLDLSYIFTALVQIAVALGAMALVVYFGYHMLSTFSEPVATTPAYTVTHSAYTDSTAYVIRDEKPIESSLSLGFADYRVNSGERVGKGEILCDVYNASEEDIRTHISKLDAEITLLEEVLTATATSGNIATVGDSVSKDYSSLMAAIASGDLAAAAKLSDTFRGSLTALAVFSGEADGINTRLSELKAQRANALARLGASIGNVSAPSIGYFFPDCDGYESIFTTELIKDFNAEDIYTAINATPEQTLSVGKIVSSPKWYVAIPVTAEDVRNYSSGKSYSLTFPDNKDLSVKMSLEKLSYDESGNAVLLFSSSNPPADFLYLRAQRVRIEYRTFEGYRVPVEAVRHYDGMTGVYTLHGGYVYFRRINVLYEGEGYYIVSKYADVEEGKPKTYRILGFNEDGLVGDYDSLHATAKKLSLEQSIYNNGGMPLKYGYSTPYFYHLADLEEIIIVGSDLYHGKVLN